jgi:hypothetical protein
MELNSELRIFQKSSYIMDVIRICEKSSYSNTDMGVKVLKKSISLVYIIVTLF